MALSHSVVHIKVGDGMLWVGGEAYPLRNISHVGTRILELDKGKAWRKFLLRTLLCMVAGLVLAGLMDTGAAMLITLALLAVVTWRLVSTLSVPPVYGLVINTSGTQRAAVWSTKPREIEYLVTEVAKAIGQPDVAQLNFTVNNAIQHGDLIQQFGANNVGKQQHFGSGNVVNP